MKSLEEIIKGNSGNHIAPFLWLHNEDDRLIVNELHRIHDCSIGAVCIESRTHEEFCREDWWSDVRLILDTCKSLGMKLWILDDKHFPSGNANGVFEKKENKHLRTMGISARQIDIAGPMKFCSVLADEWKECPDDSFIGAVALRRTEDGSMFDGEAIDISDNYANGRYFFDLPDGVWSVVLLIKTQADLAHRFDGNKLDPDATDVYIEEIYESHFRHFADDFGDTLLGFFSDEPGFFNKSKNGIAVRMGDSSAGYPWHDGLMPILRRLYGENTCAMLCRLWYDFADGSHMSVRESFMDIITARYSEAFNQRIGAWCEEHGVMYIGHIIEDIGAHKATGYGPGHYFRALGGQHMSGIDVVLHQLVPGLCEVANAGSSSYKKMDNKLNHYILGKLASSSAHTEPKKKGRAMCEIFGAFGWAEDTELMKYLADHFLVRGINYFVPHAFSPKANDTDCPPNFYNSGKNPQYKYFRLLMEYMNRMCAVTEDAVHIPTCAVIYDAEAEWSGGDFTDNKDICKALYDAQLDYDIIPFDRLSDMSDEGYINGENYPVILLPYSEYYSDTKLARLERLKKRFVCVGEKTVSGLNRTSLNNLTDFMESYRDVTVFGGTEYLRYAHYDRKGEQCYMFSNEDTKPMTVTVKLRGFSGGDYVLWDAFENKAVRRYSADGSITFTAFPNNLLVMFLGSEPGADDGKLVFELEAAGQELFTEWNIEICPENKLPDYKPYRKTSVLKSITGGDELPDFTGNIKYTSVISLDKSKHRVLDLGAVGQTAEVYLNGKFLGTRIFAPYRFDISSAVKDGKNELTVITANTCVFEQRDRYSRCMAIKPSGLLGPVMV